jgi:hypothetical protein
MSIFSFRYSSLEMERVPQSGRIKYWLSMGFWRIDKLDRDRVSLVTQIHNENIEIGPYEIFSRHNCLSQSLQIRIKSAKHSTEWNPGWNEQIIIQR